MSLTFLLHLLDNSLFISKTWATLYVFIYAMVLHPSVQAKAQEEIDQIIGEDRVPEFADRASLPYLENVLDETYRWHSAVPAGPCCSRNLFIAL